jgi:hypothetical protein
MGRSGMVLLLLEGGKKVVWQGCVLICTSHHPKRPEANSACCRWSSHETGAVQQGELVINIC